MIEREITIKLEVKYLKKEPEPKTWCKQILFCFTRPIAEFIDGFNISKLKKIYWRRKAISEMQKVDFINAVSELLYDEVLTHGTPPNIELCKMLCADAARDIFYEKKMNGGFDDLNIMVD